MEEEQLVVVQVSPGILHTHPHTHTHIHTQEHHQHQEHHQWQRPERGHVVRDHHVVEGERVSDRVDQTTMLLVYVRRVEVRFMITMTDDRDGEKYLS